jgi:hypothetical protein
MPLKGHADSIRRIWRTPGVDEALRLPPTMQNFLLRSSCSLKALSCFPIVETNQVP